ncbi:hypothetical protein ACFRAO_24185 [Streptomyces sp. NPDC056656]|uniref:DUF7848 domain-containing protein n=1 Tax=Streptomyces sp. NPDC056656 TaxID=3345895 RepID=UPI00368DBC16
MSRAVLRFTPCRISEDRSSMPTYGAVCVSGDDADCGAASGQHVDTKPVDQWMAKHTATTGHDRYQQVFLSYATVALKDGPSLESVKRP